MGLGLGLGLARGHLTIAHGLEVLLIGHALAPHLVRG